MDNATIEKLYEDFDVAIKPGQGFKYVRTRDILDRLNKTFSGNWGVQVKHHEMIEDEVLVLVSVHLYDDEGNVKATQEGFGSAKKFRNTELGNIYKSATSKAVKSAVRNWGVALFLDEDLDGDSQSTTTGRYDSSMPTTSNTPQAMPKTTPSTSVPPLPPAPPGNSVPPSTSPSPQNMGMPTNVATILPVEPKPTNVPPPPSTSSTPPNGFSTPPSGPTPIAKTPGPVAQEPVNTPPSISSGTLPTMTAVPGGPPPSTPMAEGIHAITNVQKVAITSRLGAKGLSFDQIADEFYSGKASQAPDSIDGMLYTDALDMVAFLNNK